jgi:hypothetical protein
LQLKFAFHGFNRLLKQALLNFTPYCCVSEIFPSPFTHCALRITLSRHRNSSQDSVNHPFCRDFFCLRLVTQDDSVAKDIVDNGVNVFGENEAAPAKESHSL